MTSVDEKKKKQTKEYHNSNHISKIHRLSCRKTRGVCSAKVRAPAPLSEKSATEPKTKLIGCKNIVNIATFNVRTLNTINQQLELTSSAVDALVA